MIPLQYNTIFLVLLLAAQMNAQLNIEPRFIKAIDDVVKKSNTVVVLVVERKVQLVAADIQAPRQLASLQNMLKNNKLMFIRSMYKPGSAKDVIDKLMNISKNYVTFLAYFKTTNAQAVKGSIVMETTKSAGLLGNLLASLGIHDDDAGLVPDVLNTLGIKTDRKEIQKIEFEG